MRGGVPALSSKLIFINLLIFLLQLFVSLHSESKPKQPISFLHRKMKEAYYQMNQRSIIIS